IAWETRPRPHRRCWPSRPDLGGLSAGGDGGGRSPEFSTDPHTSFAASGCAQAHALSGQPGRTDVGPGWLHYVPAIPVRHSACRMRSPLSKKLHSLPSSIRRIIKREATPARTRAAKPPAWLTLSDRFYTPTLIRPDNERGDGVMSHSN